MNDYMNRTSPMGFATTQVNSPVKATFFENGQELLPRDDQNSVDDYKQPAHLGMAKIQQLINKNHMLYASLIKLAHKESPRKSKYRSHKETISRLNQKISHLKKTYPKKLSKVSSQSSIGPKNVVIDREIKMMQFEPIESKNKS